MLKTKNQIFFLISSVQTSAEEKKKLINICFYHYDL